VNLPDGGGSQRHWVEIREHGIDGPAELGLDDGGNDLRLQRRSGILELRQLDLVGRWQEVCPGRENLPELDEGRAELFKGLPDVLRA
jgi:hypothetical protein